MQTFATAGFFDWKAHTTNGGTVSFANGGVVCSGVAGQAAHMEKYLLARPGEKITIRVMARLIDGDPANPPGIGIDYPVGGTLVNSVKIASSDWQQYELSFAVPLTADLSSQYIHIAAGSWTALSGSVEMAAPEILVESAPAPFARVWATGAILFSSSGVAISGSHANIGIRAVRLSADNKTLYAKISDPLPTQTWLPISPVVHVSVGSSAPALYAKADFSRSTGEVAITLRSLSDGGAAALSFLTANGSTGGQIALIATGL